MRTVYIFPCCGPCQDHSRGRNVRWETLTGICVVNIENQVEKERRVCPELVWYLNFLHCTIKDTFIILTLERILICVKACFSPVFNFSLFKIKLATYHNFRAFIANGPFFHQSY